MIKVKASREFARIHAANCSSVRPPDAAFINTFCDFPAKLELIQRQENNDRVERSALVAVDKRPILGNAMTV